MSSALRPVRAPQASACRVATLAGGQLTAPDGSPATDVTLTGVVLDSRRVLPGDLYAALPGEHVHGGRFAAQAQAAGAVAVLTDPVGAGLLDEADVRLPRVVVPDPRAVLGTVSAAVHGRPAEALTLIGVTGTNGKTTTAHILEAALTALGHTTGLIGTIETRVGARSVVSERTTPESCDLHALFALMVEEGADACVMEVSSHALALHRVDGATYDVAVFTNMSQDHLDFHDRMEDYFAAKAALFTPERARRAIVCVDDEWGRRLAGLASIPVQTITTLASADVNADVDVDDYPEGPDADWRVVPRPAVGDPDAFDLVGAEVTLQLHGALPGGHNRANTAFAALVLLSIGVTPRSVEKALAGGARVPGRLERVDLGADAPAVYVDFAHTPDAIAATLKALRPTTTGRLIAVVGAGGHRDRSKRPLMGAAAADGSDVVVVTDDNPRDEDPAVIRAEVAAGARSVFGLADRGAGDRVLDVDQRAAGIGEALRRAGRDDVVAVLGRGHETQQEVLGQFLPFDDRRAVRDAWRAAHA